MKNLARHVLACARRTGGYVWVASCDTNGLPHLALSSTLDMPDDTIALLGGFCCVHTIDNVRLNPRIALGVWDAASGDGWQLVGQVRNIAITEAPDASAVHLGSDNAGVHYTITVFIDKALHLTPERHSDSAM
ncbi:MAG: pyridoxamine 5'-phosphate oxidase family protein [Verrucomicrobia bacterium]|nr:pyridoxamine 5'-phosphate oxidase family protein [Verrucomicrobiota bacterium]